MASSRSRIEHHVLANGLVLVTETMPSVRSAAFTMLLPAGAAHESGNATTGLGAAVMTAEWISRGAGPRDARALLADLDNLGASHSESAQTLHTSLAVATLGRNLGAALEICADMVLRPHLDDEAVDPIRALCLQSLKSLEDDPGAKIVHELRRRHFPDPWGRSSAGTPEGVAALEPDQLRAFRSMNYRPNGAILGVAGAIDPAEIRALAEQLFGNWAPQPPQDVAEHSTGPRRDHIPRETQQTQIALAYPAANAASPDAYLARAVSAILGGYSSARLFTEVREKRGLCYSVYSTYDGQRDRAAMICHAGSTPERAQETLDVMLGEIARLAHDGIEPDELETMRAGLKSALVMAQESSISRSAALAGDWYCLGRVRPLEEIAAGFNALTTDSVSEHAAKLARLDPTILTLGPAPLKQPPQS